MLTSTSYAELIPLSSAEKEAVWRQLDRILASHFFRNSRRYPTFLRYVIEHTLEGNPGTLKERTLGVEVFGRSPTFDTTGDSIVRVAAAEVRKRLAQYYQEEGHADELRIELPAGSYVPQFRFPRAAKPSPVPEPAISEPVEAPPGQIESNPTTLPMRSSRVQWAVLSSVLALALITLVALGVHAVRRSAQADLLHTIWSSSDHVLFCVGNPTLTRNQPGEDDAGVAKQLGQPTFNNTLVPLADAMTLARLESYLDGKHKQHEVQLARETTLDELRSSPAIFIGALDNPWTMRLTSKLRFRFQGTDGTTGSIADSRKQQASLWNVDFRVPYSDRTQDYAIVAIVHDATLDRPALVVAGIGPNGTMAAGEFVTNAKDLARLAAEAPPHWGGENVEVVLATQVIEGNSGPPQILAADFW